MRLLTAAMIAGAATAGASGAMAAPTTPDGITLVEVVRELALSQPEFLWYRPGDADGRTLVFSDADQPGVSNCTAACAEEFRPLAVSPGAKPAADWSIVKRADGISQWAYNARPVYTWAKETVPGEVATNVGVSEVGTSKLAENEIKVGTLVPPEGWHVVRFAPSLVDTLPDGIDVRVVGSAHAVVLSNFEGLSLYTFSGDARKDKQSCKPGPCTAQWIPAAAPELAINMGDFSVVARADGTKQWAFKKQPLYRFSEDKLPGDAYGVGVDKARTLATVSENFRPKGVAVTRMEGYGDTLTVNGMTLYLGTAYEGRWGGRNLRDNFRNAWHKGKKLGAGACQSGPCAASWRPFHPDEGAKSTGFWEVIIREDGSKQWAYKGFALYTYAGDKAAGDMHGSDTYEIANLEDKDTFKRASFLVSISGRAGVYWHTAKP